MNGASVKVYSRAADGLCKVAENFTVREFACSDGSDAVFIAPELASVLQKVRTHFAKPVHVLSGYRTPTKNKAVGGAARSRHLYGLAADIRIDGVTPAAVAAYAETLLPGRGGIGVYETFTHIDVREKKSRWRG